MWSVLLSAETPKKNFTRPPRENNQGLLVSFKFVLSVVSPTSERGQGVSQQVFLNEYLIFCFYTLFNCLCIFLKISFVSGTNVQVLWGEYGPLKLF